MPRNRNPRINLIVPRQNVNNKQPSKKKKRPNSSSNNAKTRPVATRVHPYLRMVSAGPNESPPLYLYPDGNPEPAMVLRLKTYLTLRPTANGFLNFAIVPSMDGNVAIDTGAGFSATVNAWTAAKVQSYSGTELLLRGAAASLTGKYGVIPFSQMLGSNITPGYKSVGNFQANQFRVLSTTAKISYTGTSFNDSGSVAVCRLNVHPTIDPGQTSSINGLSSNTYAISQPPKSQADMSTISNTALFAARDDLHTLNVNVCPEFCSTFQEAIIGVDAGTTYYPNFNPITIVSGDSSTLIDGFSSGYDGNIGSTFFSYSGLNPNSTITVEAVSTIEMSFQFNSPMAAVAAPNPPKSQSVVNQVQQVFSSLPSASALEKGASAGIGYINAIKNVFNVGKKLLPMLM